MSSVCHAAWQNGTVSFRFAANATSATSADVMMIAKRKNKEARMTDPFTNKEVREYVRDAESDISQLKARVKELEAINLGLTKTLVEMEAEKAELRKESKKDLQTLSKAAWYLDTGQSARQVIDFIRCRLAFKTKQQADDEGET